MCSKSLKPSMSAAKAEVETQRPSKAYHISAGLVLSMRTMSMKPSLQEVSKTRKGAHMASCSQAPKHSSRAGYTGPGLPGM